MSVQRLVSVVRHSQQVSRVNAAIEGPRRKRSSEARRQTQRNGEWPRGAPERYVIIERVIIDPQAVPVSIAYQLLTSTVIPRQIGFISSLSPEGVANLAPFSFFNAVCGEPPMVMFSASNRRPLKDTLRNVQAMRLSLIHISEPTRPY